MSETEGQSASFLKFDFRKLIFYFVSAVFIVVVYLRWGEVDDLREIFLKSHISWLLVAIFLQALTYYFIALNYHYVFRIKGHELPIISLAPLAIITQFLNQVFPSGGMSGQFFLIDYLRHRGATVAEGVSRSILEISSLYCGFGMLFIIASVQFFSSNAFHVHPNLIYVIYIFWVFAVVALIIFFLIQRSGRKDSLLMRLISRFKNSSSQTSGTDTERRNGNKIKDYWQVFVGQLKGSMNLEFLKDKGIGNLFAFAIFCQFGVFVLDVLTLWSLTFALDVQISFALVFIIFTFTQFISMISFIPGSLVIYEGGMAILLIAYGIDRGSALTLALLFRALIFWLPMPIGWLLYRHYEKNLHKQELVS